MRNMKIPKKLYRLAALLALVLSICIVCGMYVVKYPVEGNPEELEAAACQYTEKNLTILKTMEIPENTKEEDHGIHGVADSPLAGGYLVALCESEVEGENQWTGPVLFEKGLNGKYRVVESDLTNLPWPVEAVSMNDSTFGMFGGDDDGGRAVLVLWSDIYPEEMAGYKVTYYDVERYLADGSIIPYTLDVPVEPGSKLHMLCVHIPFNYYDRNFFAYDEEENEIDLYEFRKAQGQLNGDGESRSGENPLNTDLCGGILLAGLAAAVWLWKQSNKQ